MGHIATVGYDRYPVQRAIVSGPIHGMSMPRILIAGMAIPGTIVRSDMESPFRTMVHSPGRGVFYMRNWDGESDLHFDVLPQQSAFLHRQVAVMFWGDHRILEAHIVRDDSPGVRTILLTDDGRYLDASECIWQIPAPNESLPSPEA